ncbi:MAG: hypothetical protein J2P29_14545, partial [Actinobacteria bacterium]|nr:hypothetical protein [Actinomycetota bacterium]
MSREAWSAAPLLLTKRHPYARQPLNRSPLPPACEPPRIQLPPACELPRIRTRRPSLPTREHPLPAVAAAFIVGVAVSLAASQLLVLRLERIGAWLGLSEALLGVVAAIAADAPEISAAVTALASHQQRVGAGVVLGSNVFNLAALLGLGAVVAGRIRLHRRVVLLGGTVAVWAAAVAVAVVAGVLPVAAGLALAALVVLVYVVVLGTEGRGITARALAATGLSLRWRQWLQSAVTEEEIELEDAIRPRPGRWPDVAAAASALVVVVAASVAMERAAVSLGSRFDVPEIIVGGLVLAAVTSLPNAVAA